MSKTMRRAALALACGVLALMGRVPAHAAESTPAGGWVLASTGAPVDVSGTPACEDEGQEYGPCLWDASARGNGEGGSFLVEEDGSVSYLRRADGTATASPAKKAKKTKKGSGDAPAAPAPSEPPAARAYPGWVWTGKTAPVTEPGLPACADVYGQETCTRQGYTLIVDQSACTQRIITDQGDEYVPGPAVAQALSDSCQAHKPDTRDHEDQAGLSGTRSVGGVHSASPSAAVESTVETASSGRGGAAVDAVDSSPAPERVVAPVAASSVPDNFDGAVGVVVLVLLGGGLWWGVRRSRPRRRVGRHGGGRRW